MGWGNLADHVSESVSCWRPAMAECVLTEKYHIYSARSVSWALCFYSLVLSVSRLIWPPMTRLERVVSFGLIAAAIGGIVKMWRTQTRDWGIRGNELIISGLIHPM
jgi:hypothetical protein